MSETAVDSTQLVARININPVARVFHKGRMGGWSPQGGHFFCAEGAEAEARSEKNGQARANWRKIGVMKASQGQGEATGVAGWRVGRVSEWLGRALRPRGQAAGSVGISPFL